MLGTGALLDLLHERPAGPQPHERRVQEPLGEREVAEERERRIGERVRGQLVRTLGRDVRRVRHDEVEGPPELGRERIEQVAHPHVHVEAEPGAFARASSTASGDRSVAQTRASGRSSFTASAIAPDPVPRSTTAGPRTDAIRSRATPTTTSVSGRGTKTPRPDLQDEPPEPLLSGQVLQRGSGAAQAERAAVRARLRGGEPVGAREDGGPAGAEHAHHEPFRVRLRRLDPVPFEVGGAATDHLGRAHQPSSSASCWARSAACSASMKPSSSSPPARTSASWCEVCLIR